jgi:hypothetical protein
MGSNPNGFTRQGNSHSGARYYVMEADGSFRLFLSQVCPTEEPGLYTLRNSLTDNLDKNCAGS